MALNVRCFSCVRKNVMLLLVPRRLEPMSKKQYAIYPDYYENPVFKKDKLEALYKEGEAEKLILMPIKAAINDQTCSVFHNDEVNKFTNYIMRKGKKVLARELMEKTFEIIKRIQVAKYHKTEKEESKNMIVLNPPDILHSAITNCIPVLYLVGVVRGGATYQVPMPVPAKKGRFMAMNWLIQAAKEKGTSLKFEEKLAHVLLDAAKNTGRVVKKKQDLHKQCEANRGYAHYRWG